MPEKTAQLMSAAETELTEPPCQVIGAGQFGYTNEGVSKTLQEMTDAMDRSTNAASGLLYPAKEHLAEAMVRASLRLSRR